MSTIRATIRCEFIDDLSGGPDVREFSAAFPPKGNGNPNPREALAEYFAAIIDRARNIRGFREFYGIATSDAGMRFELTSLARDLVIPDKGSILFMLGFEN